MSAPELTFPAAANQHAAALQFAGATVDGRPNPIFPTLTGSAARY